MNLSQLLKMDWAKLFSGMLKILQRFNAFSKKEMPFIVWCTALPKTQTENDIYNVVMLDGEKQEKTYRVVTDNFDSVLSAIQTVYPDYSITSVSKDTNAAQITVINANPDEQNIAQKEKTVKKS